MSEKEVLKGVNMCVNKGDIYGVIGKNWMDSVTVLCYTSIAIVFVYCMQNGTLGLVIYILMASGSVYLE